jgi:hypothetical protein
LTYAAAAALGWPWSDLLAVGAFGLLCVLLVRAALKERETAK